jgi:predicted O-methyltransferase YrrM
MILHADVERYLHELQPSTDPVLLEMERIGQDRGFPIIGPLVGRLCETLARAIGARTVYEMGSGFGYSTYWFARAVGPDGWVTHTDGSAENSALARSFLSRAGLASRVRFQIGDSRELIQTETGPFDIVFCDIDKEGYPEALELAKPRIRRGGLLITDNVLWSGRVAQPGPDAETEAIQAYNRATFSAPDLVGAIVPLRDGVGVHVKL